MNLTIHKPAGLRICPDLAQQAWQHHPGGWGMVRWAAGRAVVHRGMGLAELLALLARIPVERPAVLHLGQAADDPEQLAMTLPVAVRPGLYLVHSSTKADGAVADEATSTAHELAQQLASVLAPLPKCALPRVIRSDGFARLLAPAIGSAMLHLCDDVGLVTLGPPWHTLGSAHWADPDAHGLQVSSLHRWLDATPASLRLVA